MIAAYAQDRGWEVRPRWEECRLTRHRWGRSSWWRARRGRWGYEVEYRDGNRYRSWRVRITSFSIEQQDSFLISRLRNLFGHLEFDFVDLRVVTGRGEHTEVGNLKKIKKKIINCGRLKYYETSRLPYIKIRLFSLEPTLAKWQLGGGLRPAVPMERTMW